MRPPPISAAFRRKLLAQPGITPKPVCPTCHQERDPHDFTNAGICRGCHALTPAGTLAMVLTERKADQVALARELVEAGFRPTPAMIEAHPELAERYAPRSCVCCHHDISSWGECPTCDPAF